MAVNTAPVKWAQRADSIYLTLDLPDVKDEQLKLTKDMLSFRQVVDTTAVQHSSSILYFTIIRMILLYSVPGIIMTPSIWNEYSSNSVK